MKKRVVLISGIGGDIGQSIARTLADDFTLIGCDMVRVGIHKTFVQEFFCISPAKDGEGFFRAIADIIRRKKVSFFIPVPEPDIQALDKMRGRFKMLGAKVLLNNAEILENFSDKLRTAEFLRKNGWPAPRTVLLKHAVPAEWPLPFIVKDRRGWGSKNFRIVRDRADLIHVQAKDDGGFIAQEYLPDTDGEYTTGVFSNGVKIVSISFRRELGFGGLSREIELIPAPYLKRLAENIARKIKLIGCFNIQSRKVGKDYVPFEINPRISSTAFFRHKFGFLDVRWWIDTLSGQDFTYKPLFKKGRACRYLVEELFDMEPCSKK